MTGTTARYHQIADEIQRRINNGHYTYGTLLPSEAAFAKEFHVARGTIRDAIAHLRTAGTVTTDPGRGTFVAPPQPRRRLESRRHQDLANKISAGSVDEPDEPYPGTIQVTAKRQPDVAPLFGVPDKTVFIERNHVLRQPGVPVDMGTTYLLADDVGNTRLADKHHPAWPGTTLLYLAESGIHVTDIREVLSAKIPHPAEVAALNIPSGTPALVSKEFMYAGKRIVCYSETLRPAPGLEIIHHIPIDWPPPGNIHRLRHRMDPAQAFAELIRSARVAAEMTQEDLAQSAGVSRRTLTRWETGHADRPHGEDVRAVCRALKIHPHRAAAALGFIDDPDPPRSREV